MNIHASGHSQNGLCQFVRLKMAEIAPDCRRGRPVRSRMGMRIPEEGHFLRLLSKQETVLWEIVLLRPWHELCLFKVGAGNQELFGSKQDL
jgi:hypothetical protein